MNLLFPYYFFLVLASTAALARAQRNCTRQEPCDDGKFCSFQEPLTRDHTGHCVDCVSPEDCANIGLDSNAAIEDCISSCTTKCSADLPCSEEGTFCTYEYGETGICEVCEVSHERQCFDLDHLSILGKGNCVDSCKTRMCFDEANGTALVGEQEFLGLVILNTPYKSASGPLIDCGLALTTCSGVNNSVCLVEQGEESTTKEKIKSCEEGGGVAAILYGDQLEANLLGVFFDRIEDFWKLELDTSIPSIILIQKEGKYLRENALGDIATVNNMLIGEECHGEGFGCDDTIPCLDREYCVFGFNHDYGWCASCDAVANNEFNPGGNCYFMGDSLRAAEDCVARCGGAQIGFPECKFCLEDISSSTFGTTEQCDFCPNNDMQYRHRVIRLFGPNVQCWHMEEFFRNYPVDKLHQNCQLSQMYNYICGCAGPGYGGANTAVKRRVLAWLPRVSAILSFMCSAILIYCVMKDKRRRRGIKGQLLIMLATFDLFGSVAYALSTLPLPKEDFIYGSKGNTDTCKAQGFFIQLGTISAFTNVSLAIYYLLVVKYSWNDNRLKKIKFWLFSCPLVVGLSFALAGIPYYDNMILWCNNSSRYWPEIPMVIAICMATCIMVTLCHHVHKEENVSKVWRKNSSRNMTTSQSMSTKVFWQSFWYLMAFYCTWPTYLALQFLWASGKAYSMYGFILFAGTTVPLQGVWNLFVFLRLHDKDIVTRSLRGLARQTSSVLSTERLSNIFNSINTLFKRNQSVVNEEQFNNEDYEIK